MADPTKTASSQQQTQSVQSEETVEKVKVRLLAHAWSTNHPKTGALLNFKQGDEFIVSRDMFNSVNDSFRPAFEEIKEEK